VCVCEREGERINRFIFCVFFKKRERGGEGEDKQTYLVCFLKKEKSERGGGR
jgi:hypothetical protein